MLQAEVGSGAPETKLHIISARQEDTLLLPIYESIEALGKQPLNLLKITQFTPLLHHFI